MKVTRDLIAERTRQTFPYTARSGYRRKCGRPPLMSPEERKFASEALLRQHGIAINVILPQIESASALGSTVG